MCDACAHVYACIEIMTLCLFESFNNPLFVLKCYLDWTVWNISLIAKLMRFLCTNMVLVLNTYLFI